MKVKTILFFITVIFAATVILISRCVYNGYGMPIIEEKIGSQLTSLMSNTPALTSFPVGGLEGAKAIGDSPPYNGKLWYQTRFNNENCYLIVFWEGDSNACDITKIVVEGTDTKAQTIWQK